MEDYGNDLIVVTDEDGNEIEMEHLDTIERDGETYMAFAIAEDEMDDAADLVILRVDADEENNEEYFSSIEDENLFQELYELFCDRLEEYYEFSEESSDEE